MVKILIFCLAINFLILAYISFVEVRDLLDRPPEYTLQELVILLLSSIIMILSVLCSIAYTVYILQ